MANAWDPAKSGPAVRQWTVQKSNNLTGIQLDQTLSTSIPPMKPPPIPQCLLLWPNLAHKRRWNLPVIG